MMRPYFAIIKDSFRAAMASRVLYVLLLLIALLLAALAPLHLSQTLDWKLIAYENTNPDQLGQRLVDRQNSPRHKPAQRIWDSLSAPLKERLNEKYNRASKSDESERRDETPAKGSPLKKSPRESSASMDEIALHSDLVDELNEVIASEDFYRPADWADRVLSVEAEELLQGIDNLGEERRLRLNRLLMAHAVSPAIQQGKTALEFWYATWRLDFLTTSSTHQQFADSLTSQLPFYFQRFVLSIGLFIAILVTANMVPETFEPGSLNLLLSKPVSRWGLYLAKFAGGCVFILICATFLFAGLWLWLGLAMEVWDRAILLSIPLYVIVFAIYFSVSSLAGLIWRSAIVAVILTILFWAVCSATGMLYGFFNVKMKNSEILEVRKIGNEILMVDSLLQMNRLERSKWRTVLAAGISEQDMITVSVASYMAPMRYSPAVPGVPGAINRIAPIEDPVSGTILASTYESTILASSKKLYVADAEKLEFSERGQFPRETLKIMKAGPQIVAVTATGEFFKLDREKLSLAKPLDDSDEPINVFEAAGPNRRVDIRSGIQVDANPEDGRIAVFNQGELTVFAPNADQEYEQLASLEIDVAFGKEMSCLVAFRKEVIVLVFGNGKVITIDAESLEERNEYQPETRTAPDTIDGSPSGRYFAIRYRNGNLWVLDVENDEQMTRPGLAGQGSICAVTFSDDNQLLVAEHTNRVSIYDLTTNERIRRIAAPGTWFENLFRYGINPVYRLFPKPGEFYKVVTYLSAAGDTSENDSIDLRLKGSEYDNPWLPLRSGLAFMTAMLLIACAIFHRKDF